MSDGRTSASRGDVDVVVVGAGAAGLYAALCAAREGASVALLSAMPLAQTASYWAQGGLAAALAADDSVELHLSDTERGRAGSGEAFGCRGAGERGAGVRARPGGVGLSLRRGPPRALGARASRVGTR